MSFTIQLDDPSAADVIKVLTRHMEFSRSVSPPDHVHALDVDGLLDPAVRFYSARIDGKIAGIGALKQLDDTHAELKSMHTLEEARGLGIGRAMVEHLLGVAKAQGISRVSLETGSMNEFGTARSLYQSLGFTPCPPFGNYTSNPYSMCMTQVLG